VCQKHIDIIQKIDIIKVGEDMKKTKIICTIGPVSSSKEVMQQMIEEGMDVIRINLSHANHSFCEKVLENIRELNEQLNKNIAILFDLEGPELRVGKFKNGSAFFEKDDIIRIMMDNIMGDKTSFSVNYKDLYKEVTPGTKILVVDGLIELTVINVDQTDIVCRVNTSGVIEDDKGMNIPGLKVNMPFLSEEDKANIIFANKMNVDFLGLSGVSNSADVLDVSDLLIQLKNDHISIISKIETESAVEEIDDIIKVSDGIMVARGDLGVELPMEKLPLIQKSIIEKCYQANKISIVATEMLASMQSNARPTRAEVSDVANAVLDGVDAVMLSGETTVGDYPIETVNIMRRIIETTEEDINYLDLLNKAMEAEKQDITSAIAYSVVDSANRLKVNNIVTSTTSGYTARKISHFRPNCPIIAITPNDDTVKSLTLNWGVYPVLVHEFNNTDQIIKTAKEVSKKLMNLDTGDLVIITGEFPIGKVNHTNFMKIEEI
jgi:pyruvate kinase